MLPDSWAEVYVNNLFNIFPKIYFVFKKHFFAASTVPDSSEDELLEKQPPPKVKKLPTPASESPRKSRMGPKKSALAQVSASQDEDETMNDTDLMPTTKGKSVVSCNTF